MKEFNFTDIYRGIQFEVLGVCKTKKEAALVFDRTLYFLKNWTFGNTPRTPEATQNPGVVFAKFDNSGESPYVEGYEKGKVFKIEDLKKLIDSHRLKYPTRYHLGK